MKILYLIYKDKIFFEFLFNFREERSKTKFLESLSQNILRMFHLLELFPLTKSEIKPDFYHQELNISVAFVNQ